MIILKNILDRNKQNIINLSEPELHNLKVLYYLYAFLILSAYIMPQYFGVHIGYDITCTRFANILIMLYMILNPKILTHFFRTSFRCEIFIPLIIYLFVSFYTMVYRIDINAFFLIFLELLTLFMFIYGIRYVVGYKRAIKWSILCAYFFSIYGMLEYVYGRSIFLQFLSTVPNNVKNSYRSGHYRIMGPCGHSLGYGLLLLIFIALACLDVEKNKLYIFKRPVLITLLLVNVFLTGSRSTLGIAVIEVIVIFLFSDRKNVKKTLLMLVAVLVCFGVFLLLFYKTSMGQYIMGQITSVVDHALGTNYAANFGVDTTTLENSKLYREALPYIFTLDWLNPLVGRGTKFSGAEVHGIYMHSCDNYYVAQYIKYAYPGLASYVLFMLVILVVLIRQLYKRRSAITKAVLIGAFFYFYNLWWVDSLQTLKFVYILIAIFYAYYLEDRDIGKRKICELKQKCG